MQLNLLNIEHFYQLQCHVYWKDLLGIYQGSNDYLATRMGVLKGNEIIGRTDFDLCHLSSACKFRSDDQTVIMQNKPLHIQEKVQLIKNNIHYSVYTHKQPLCNAKGKTIGVLGISFMLDQHHDCQGLDAKSQSKKQLHQLMLTKRQEDCLFLLVMGKSAKEIAKQLNISFRTVEHHLETIKIKFHCYSRSELIAKALTCPIIKEKLIPL